MDTQRLILLVVFSFSVLMLWESWQKEQRPQTVAAAKPEAPAEATVPAGTVPESTLPKPTAPVARAEGAVPTSEAVAGNRQRIRVTTPLLLVEIDPLGGDIVRVELLRHKDAIDQTKNLVLFSGEHRYSAQSGFTATQFPNHKTIYRSARSDYVLGAGDEKLEVVLEADTEGVRGVKRIAFHRDSYVVDIVHEAVNDSAVPVAARGYFHLTRDSKAPAGDQYMLQTFTGPALYSEATKYLKVSWSDIDKNKSGFPTGPRDEGWVGVVQHYFVSAWIAGAGAKREFYANKLDVDFYRVGMIVDAGVVEPGGKLEVGARLYAGPQEQDRLNALAPGLDLVVDYGVLTVFAAPLFWLLRVFHDGISLGGVGIPGTGNWGWAIVLLTILVKLVFFPLSAASYRSMAKMKIVTPLMMKLREQYGDDRAKLNQAMMELYRKEKINPLGGCLPILVQIPVFIALYWVLLGSVELRQAPFIGWIKDLSAQDPWYVLPVLMLASMVIQTRMSPTPPDPIQAKVMMAMPFVFGIMFFWFPAGLVLYWFVNNVLSIAQQWQITRMFGEKRAAANLPKR